MGSRSSETVTGIILPLYIYPGTSWQAVIHAKRTRPSVPIISIINPGTGPGGFRDPNYVSGIKQLQSAGVTVLGYVFTQYASRKQSAVIADIDAYKNWYDVDGIMFDEMSVSPGNEEYYSFLEHHVKSAHMTVTLGNPGKKAPPGYLGTMDILNIYEDLGMPGDCPQGDSPIIGREKLSMIAYGVEDFDRSSLEAISRCVAFLYLTDANLPNPYDRLPTFFSRLVDALGETGPPLSSSATTSTKSHLSWFSTKFKRAP